MNKDEFDKLTTDPMDVYGDEFDYFDEYPEDDPFSESLDGDLVIDDQDLLWQDAVRQDLVEAVTNFLQFGSIKELLELITEIL